jgi:hypothetical protein
MKMLRALFAAFTITLIFSACSVFKPKYGCGSNGRNVGAEKLIDGTEGSKKAPKFKG